MRLLGGGAIFIGLLGAAAAGGAGGPAEVTPLGPNLEATRSELVSRVNRARSAAGMEPFSRQAALDRAAQQAALELSERASAGPGREAEASPLSVELERWLLEAGYDAKRAAATAIVSEGVADSDLEDLLFPAPSPEDRSTLLDPGLRELGVGLAGLEDTQVVVLVSALSRVADFERLIGPLEDLEAVRSELLSQSNSARERSGRRDLERDACLERVAQAYADEMVARSFYGHVSPDGLDAFERARAGRCFNPKVAENLAQGPAAARETVDGWMASPGHRANLLDRDLNRVGFGVAAGRNEAGFQIVWVQLLGS